MKIFDFFDKLINGHDIFISYSRRDGMDYSYTIAEHFMAKGYDCYIDQLTSTTPGKNLPSNIIRDLKRSTAMVIVGSPGAVGSESIKKEIETFLTVKKNSPFVAINIEDSITQAIWHETVEGLPLIDETRGALESNKPSDDILSRINNSLSFTRKSKRLRTISAIVLLVTLTLSGFLLTQFDQVKKVTAAITTAQAELASKQTSLDKAREDSVKAQKQIARLNIIKDSLDKVGLKLSAANNTLIADKEVLNADKEKLASLNNKIQASLKIETDKLNLAKKEFNAVQTATNAMMETQKDPTKAVELAMRSDAEKRNGYASNVLLTMFNSDNLFYKKRMKGLKDIALSQDSRSVMLQNNGDLFLGDVNGNVSKKIESATDFNEVMFTYNNSLIIGLSNYGVNVYDKDGHFIKEFEMGFQDAIVESLYIKEKEMIVCRNYKNLHLIDLKNLSEKAIELTANNTDTSRIKKMLYSKANDEVILVHSNGSFSRFSTGGELKEKALIINLEKGDYTWAKKGKKVNISNIYTIGGGKYFLILNQAKIIVYNYRSHSYYNLSYDSTLNTPYEINVSADEKYFTITYMNVVKLYKLDNNSLYTELVTLDIDNGISEDVFISPLDNRIILTNTLGELFLYDSSGALIGECKGHTNPKSLSKTLKEIAWGNYQDGLVTLGNDSLAIFWNLGTFRKKYFDEPYINYSTIYAVNHNYSMIAIVELGKDDKRVVINTIGGSVLGSFNFPDKFKKANRRSLDFSKDDTYLRLVVEKDGIYDTVYYDLRSKLLSASVNEFAEISDFNAKDWNAKWEDGSLEGGHFTFSNNSGYQIELPSKIKGKPDIYSYKISPNGTICSKGLWAFEVFFLDVDKVAKKFKEYNLQ